MECNPPQDFILIRYSDKAPLRYPAEMFRVIDCDEDLIYFQEDLDKLHQWSQRNQMDFNTKKCKIMRITRKQVPFTNSVHMNDTVLEEVKEFKDLGILTDCSLSWNSHTDMITAKANRMLGLIKRTCKDLKDTATLKTLFCSLVRSNLESLWNTVRLSGLLSQRETETNLKEFNVGMRFAMTNVLKNSFFHRIVGKWNILPYIRSAPLQMSAFLNPKL